MEEGHGQSRDLGNCNSFEKYHADIEGGHFSWDKLKTNVQSSCVPGYTV